MKLVSVGHDKMYPPIGCAQRSYHMSRYLSKNFDITLIGHSGAITRFRKHRINKNFSIIEIPGIMTSGMGALGYFLTKKPLFDPFVAWTCTKSPHLLKHYLREVENADILVFEGCWHYQLIDKVKDKNKKLIVYDAHNVEYLLKRQVYSGIFRKLLPKIFELEKKTCIESDIILATCEKEKEMFIKLYEINSGKVHVIPNCVALPEKDGKTDEKTILFIGGAYFANFEAVRFINETLAKALPDFVFRIVGRAGMGTKNKKKNVEVYGMVSEEKKDELLRSSEIAINPILHGAGMNVKMLEYMAYGLPA
ncbi:MAG: glycosyltransferase family 4 protein, partial [Nanoarchaeota archaeon]|nr:glycosyltransferase family 4 protein [Nanoarchaeota archaeon]